jgi:hypothetical protein
MKGLSDTSAEGRLENLRPDQGARLKQSVAVEAKAAKVPGISSGLDDARSRLRPKRMRAINGVG